jgi:hypothetical protein
VISVNLIDKESPAYNLSENINKTRVLISHYPVLPNYLSKSLLDKFQPDIIFSAHDHESKESVMDRKDHTISFPVTLKTQRIFDFESLKQKQKIVEISLQPASYRMGTLKIGFAQAVFDDGKLFYSPLFTISRFHQLAAYIFVVIVMIFMNFCCSQGLQRRKNVEYERLI